MPTFIMIDGSPATVTWRGHANSATAAASDPHTFTAVAAGAAFAGRILFASIMGRSAGATISAVTIGGVAAAAQSSQATNADQYGQIWNALVPTGTTADVVVTRTGASGGGLTVNLFSAEGLQSATSTASATSIAGDPTASINVSAGGFVIGGAISVASTGTVAPVGITEDQDTIFDSNRHYTAGSANFASAQTGLTVTFDYSAPGTSVGAFAAFR